MNITKKIEILQHATEYIVDAKCTAEAKHDDTLGMHYDDVSQYEIIQDAETLIVEMNYLIIGLRLQEEIGND